MMLEIKWLDQGVLKLRFVGDSCAPGDVIDWLLAVKFPSDSS